MPSRYKNDNVPSSLKEGLVAEDDLVKEENKKTPSQLTQAAGNFLKAFSKLRSEQTHQKPTSPQSSQPTSPQKPLDLNDQDVLQAKLAAEYAMKSKGKVSEGGKNKFGDFRNKEALEAIKIGKQAILEVASKEEIFKAIEAAKMRIPKPPQDEDTAPKPKIR